MALDGLAKERFISELTRQLLKGQKDPSGEVVAGMRDYATTLYESIAELIRSADVLNSLGEVTDFKLK